MYVYNMYIYKYIFNGNNDELIFQENIMQCYKLRVYNVDKNHARFNLYNIFAG